MPDALHVFVYGTLRRGASNDITRLMPAPKWVGAARVRGVMYHLGSYPGVTLSAAHNSAAKASDGLECMVLGEVFAIEPALERVLDEIEELYPQQKDEYFKRRIEVWVQGKAYDCIFYEINPAYLVGRAVIASGDWLLV